MNGPGILILAEGAALRTTLELVALGLELSRDLGDRIDVLLLGGAVGESARRVAAHTPGRILVAESPELVAYDPDAYLAVLAEVCRREAPRLVLASHGSLGQDLLPRVAFSLGGGLVTDCVDVVADGAALLFAKPVHGGNLLVTQRVTSDVALATIRAGVRAPAPASEVGGAIVAEQVQLPSRRRLGVREKVAFGEEARALEHAPVVVAGGRGMGGAEGFAQLRELASLLGGAVGASRPPVDAGWISTACQIGITGKVVAPDLYIAVAISGSSQHLSGMGDSAKIVAINRDADAPIFEVSDYGVVGDWRQVVPALASQLAELGPAQLGPGSAPAPQRSADLDQVECGGVE